VRKVVRWLSVFILARLIYAVESCEEYELKLLTSKSKYQPNLSTALWRIEPKSNQSFVSLHVRPSS